MSAAAIAARVREVGRVSDLAPARRLDAKIGLSAAAIARRIRTVSELRELCVRLGRLGEAGPTAGSPRPAGG